MPHEDIERWVSDHYGWSGLMKTIEEEIRRHGIEPSEVTVAQLAPGRHQQHRARARCRGRHRGTSSPARLTLWVRGDRAGRDTGVLRGGRTAHRMDGPE
jgi:hypothetical protein